MSLEELQLTFRSTTPFSLDHRSFLSLFVNNSYVQPLQDSGWSKRSLCSAQAVEGGIQIQLAGIEMISAIF